MSFHIKILTPCTHCGRSNEHRYQITQVCNEPRVVDCEKCGSYYAVGVIMRPVVEIYHVSLKEDLGKLNSDVDDQNEHYFF